MRVVVGGMGRSVHRVRALECGEGSDSGEKS